MEFLTDFRYNFRSEVTGDVIPCAAREEVV